MDEHLATRARLAMTPPGLVAQSVAQRIENPCVGGSIPPRATKNILDETPTHAGRRFVLGDRGPRVRSIVGSLPAVQLNHRAAGQLARRVSSDCCQ
jgi:hypothetical protein